MASAEGIDLISTAASYTTALRNPVEVHDPQSGKRVTEPGVILTFRNGRTRVSPEVWKLVQQAPCYTGEGGRKYVYRLDEAVAVPPEGSGPRVVTGALGTAPKPTFGAPSADWDTAGVVKLAQCIAEGEFDDRLEAAFSYEMATKRRTTVGKALTDRLFRTSPSEEAEPPPPAASAEPPEVEIPDGQGGF